MSKKIFGGGKKPVAAAVEPTGPIITALNQAKDVKKRVRSRASQTSIVSAPTILSDKLGA